MVLQKALDTSQKFGLNLSEPPKRAHTGRCKKTHGKAPERPETLDSARGDKKLCAPIFRVLHKLNFTHTLNVKIDSLCQIIAPGVLGRTTGQN